MEPQTNAVLDLRTFGHMFLGRQPGQAVSKEEFEADKKAYEYYVKQAIDKTMTNQAGPSDERPVDVGYITNAPRVTMETNAAGNVITNTNSGPIVHQVERFADGTFKIIPPSVQNFRGGSAEVVAPGTTRYLTNEQTRATEQNYSSEYSEGGAGAATIGAYSAGAGAPAQVVPPAATTVNTTTAPSVAPPPSQSSMPQANQPVRVISPDGKSGIIPATQLDQALRQGFRLAP
jgi:hypothetical protein